MKNEIEYFVTKKTTIRQQCRLCGGANPSCLDCHGTGVAVGFQTTTVTLREALNEIGFIDWINANFQQKK